IPRRVDCLEPQQSVLFGSIRSLRDIGKEAVGGNQQRDTARNGSDDGQKDVKCVTCRPPSFELTAAGLYATRN
ncbi:MAG TPA: hypothetical protein VF727_12895, partial [Allosphingosinicella sp.]